MVGGLLSAFDLTELNACIHSGVVKHSAKQFIGHKVRTGAGGKIAAPWQQLHGLGVDSLITLYRIGNRLAALGKRRRIENYVVIFAFLPSLKLCQKVKHILADKAHAFAQSVELRIASGEFYRIG